MRPPHPIIAAYILAGAVASYLLLSFIVPSFSSHIVPHSLQWDQPESKDTNLGGAAITPAPAPAIPSPSPSPSSAPTPPAPLTLEEIQEKESHLLDSIKGMARDVLEPKGSKIVLLSASDGHGHNNAIANLFERATSNRLQYCAFHDYVYQYIDLSRYEADGRSAVWHKIPAIKDTFDLHPDAEWIWWLDMDAIIMTPTLDLASLVLNPDVLARRITYGEDINDTNGKPTGVRVNSTLDVSDVDLVVAQDFSLNAGSFFLRRSDFTFDLLDKWLDRANPEFNQNNEQDALNRLIVQNEDIRSHVGFVDLRLINAFGVGGRDMGWYPGDLVVHFAGCWVHKECSKRFEKLWPQRHTFDRDF
ncbi:galactosyl transferase GMA12/MNN10 family-domain-containing protein [Myxozyma melibiosi]|uniref:Galactosyl transferase GMA12/MNN10 family-domain-containing protein n=1 Tax=Myxozyma melibiosi TaxID=54550 RepID=A0ABR1F9X7_9ASCO